MDFNKNLCLLTDLHQQDTTPWKDEYTKKITRRPCYIFNEDSRDYFTSISKYKYLLRVTEDLDEVPG